MVVITRKAEFSASHFLNNPDWSPERNEEVFGIEARPHGHNYVLEVSIAGQVDPSHGMIIDLKQLKEVINQEIVEPWDHRFLNHEAPPFDKVNPTVENVAAEIWKRLAPAIRSRGANLDKVRLYETADLYCDYRGLA